MFGRDEGQESCVAGTGHAQSVPATGGAGSLHNDPHREPDCLWLHVWSHCKLIFIDPLINHDLFSEIQLDDILISIFFLKQENLGFFVTTRKSSGTYQNILLHVMAIKKLRLQSFSLAAAASSFDSLIVVLH